MIQMRVDPGDPPANLARAQGLVALAVSQGARLILLPEAMDVGWTHCSARSLAAPIPDGRTCKTLAAAAREHHVHLCAGLSERAGDRIFNAAVLISPEGDVILLHRKINEMDFARDLYATGDRLAVAHTDLGVLGLMVCADAFAPGQVISRTLALMGAQLILSPCAWAVPADHDNTKDPYGQLWLDNYQPVAREFHLYIAGVSNVGPILDGPWSGRLCIGCSLLIAPDAHPVLTGPYGPDAQSILYADIALPSA